MSDIGQRRTGRLRPDADTGPRSQHRQTGHLERFPNRQDRQLALEVCSQRNEVGRYIIEGWKVWDLGPKPDGKSGGVEAGDARNR